MAYGDYAEGVMRLETVIDSESEDFKKAWNTGEDEFCRLGFTPEVPGLILKVVLKCAIEQTAWEAFGWWEGENPFKDFETSDDFAWDITYIESLDPKRAMQGHSEPQGKRAYFVVSDMQKALDALTGIAASFSVGYEGRVVKLYAWNEEKPDFKACLMAKYDWGAWCGLYYERYTDSGRKLLEYTYDINTPNPEFKDGKLVFGDEFSKTPEEFIHDLVRATKF